MKGLFGRLAAVALALGILAAPLAAQQSGNPVYVGGDGTGVTLNGDFGYLASTGDSKYVGGRATFGASMVAVNAGGGYHIDAEEVTFGANAAVNFLSFPGSPVKIGAYAGVGYVNALASLITIPVGAVLTFSPPSPSMGVDVWVAPGIRYSRLGSFDIAGVSVGSSSETDFGGSAGVNLNMPSGLGFHAALDYTNTSPGSSPFLIGVGVHFKLGT